MPARQFGFVMLHRPGPNSRARLAQVSRGQQTNLPCAAAGNYAAFSLMKADV